MKTTTLLATLALVFAACGDGTSTDDGGDGADGGDALVDTYRNAIPDKARLTATDPAAGKASGDAKLPGFADEVVQGVNGAIASIIDGIQDVVSEDPAGCDESTKECIWAPLDAGANEPGKLLAYIKEDGGGDYPYTFALARYDPDDENVEAEAVIIGFADPEGDTGVILLDHEANNRFLTSNGGSAAAETGRFVAIYGSFTESDSQADVSYVYAVTGAGFQGVKANLFYGRISKDSNTLDFLDWEAGGDFCDASLGCFENHSDPGNTNLEGMKIQMAFLNSAGHGYAGVAGADIDTGVGAADAAVVIYECWDAAIEQKYMTVSQDLGSTWTDIAGEAAGCDTAVASFDQEKLPSLDDIPEAARDEINCAAENGFGHPSCGG